MPIERQAHALNRLSWNAATAAHDAHKPDASSFLTHGGTTLFPEERELLGPIDGLRVAHLLCNNGHDSLSLAALGARVVGVDISDTAIANARHLSQETGIEARFERADVYDWLDAETDDRFDVVFLSYGALGWLSDLPAFVRGVRARLAPGGRLVIMEFHPLAWSFNDRGPFGDDYFGGAFQGPVNDYVADAGDALAPMGFVETAPFHNPHDATAWQWTTAGLLQAIADADLRIEAVREWPWSNGCRLFAGMRAIDGRRFTVPDGWAPLPLMLGVVARA